MAENTLYYGDNLDILRRYIKDESVDLIYLDPPFNSAQSYNVLFAERDGTQAAAQIRAFEDTWQWDQAAALAFEQTVEAGGKVSLAMQAFRRALDDNDMLAYLAMMAPRIVHLHRVLGPAGSLYLHCDPAASHYLKMLLDSVFGPESFRNEIIWRRTNAKGLAFTRFATNHDVILRYSKSEKWTWNPQYVPHDPEYLRKFYRFTDPLTGRRYRLADLTNPNKNRPNLTYEFLGVTRVWRWTKERMLEAQRAGLVVQSKPGAVPALKRYLDEQEGNAVDDIWTDILPVQAQAGERLGYPTQKPEALLERIIKASSNVGDVVLDPFCGCGTAIAVAERLERRWIGIDVTFIAINLIKERLKDTFPDRPVDYQVLGEPVSLPDAENLARQDPHQFQEWAFGRAGGRRSGVKKGGDKGIDGRLYFHEGEAGGKTRQVIISVKAGHTGPDHVRDLRGVVDREKAEIGVLLTLHAPTQQMRAEAASAGFYEGWGGKKYPKLQILAVEELLAGKGVDMPPQDQVNVTFKKAPKAEKEEPGHPELDL